MQKGKGKAVRVAVQDSRGGTNSSALTWSVQSTTWRASTPTARQHRVKQLAHSPHLRPNTRVTYRDSFSEFNIRPALIKQKCDNSCKTCPCGHTRRKTFRNPCNSLSRRITALACLGARYRLAQRLWPVRIGAIIEGCIRWLLAWLSQRFIDIVYTTVGASPCQGVR